MAARVCGAGATAGACRTGRTFHGEVVLGALGGALPDGDSFGTQVCWAASGAWVALCMLGQYVAVVGADGCGVCVCCDACGVGALKMPHFGAKAPAGGVGQQ